jgi:hypothetical protein
LDLLIDIITEPLIGTQDAAKVHPHTASTNAHHPWQTQTQGEIQIVQGPRSAAITAETSAFMRMAPRTLTLLLNPMPYMRPSFVRLSAQQYCQRSLQPQHQTLGYHLLDATIGIFKHLIKHCSSIDRSLFW